MTPNNSPTQAYITAPTTEEIRGMITNAVSREISLQSEKYTAQVMEVKKEMQEINEKLDKVIMALEGDEKMGAIGLAKKSQQAYEFANESKTLLKSFKFIWGILGGLVVAVITLFIEFLKSKLIGGQ